MTSKSGLAPSKLATVGQVSLDVLAFIQSQAVLDAMGVDGTKTGEAPDELREKGMAP